MILDDVMGSPAMNHSEGLTRLGTLNRHVAPLNGEEGGSLGLSVIMHNTTISLSEWESMAQTNELIERTSVALNNDGTKIARGVIVHKSSKGKVSVSEYTDGNWYDNSGSQLTSIGSDISGLSSGELAGWSCDINAVGERVIVGAPGYENYAGTARVYAYSNNQW